MKLQISDFARIGWTPEELDDQIFLVRGALTSNECEEILSELRSYTDEQWAEEYLEAKRHYSLRQYGRTMEELIAEGVFSLDTAWMDKNILVKQTPLTQSIDARISKLISTFNELSFRGIVSAQRQYEGVELKLHTDGDSEPALAYAVIFYLNDDYTGGQLYFPTRSLEVRLPAGSVVIFPTTSEYRHGVHPVGPGPVRYVLPSFIQSNQES